MSYELVLLFVASALPAPHLTPTQPNPTPLPLGYGAFSDLVEPEPLPLGPNRALKKFGPGEQSKMGIIEAFTLHCIIFAYVLSSNEV